MINRVVLVGRLTRDPNELRRSQSGVGISGFTVAVDNRFSKQEDRNTDFIACVVFGKTAEFVTQYARKGALVGVEGRLQSRSYEKNGQKVYVTEVVCDNVQLLESKSVSQQRQSETPMESRGGSYQAPSESRSKEYYASTPVADERRSQIDINDDDLPF
ncbi:MAG: single-stranded DNA-binding protein [Bacilli bacterium]|jgi:single-strand DNA-binding protein|nr:single-stranded DNA-binding protein [Bacteroidia bacterium]